MYLMHVTLKYFFCVSLNMHLSLILVINQLDAQILAL